MTGQALELAVLLSVRSGDEAAFERNYAQLRVYYGDARGVAGLGPSAAEAQMTGLNLLRLLVQGRTAEFHTELEVVPQELLGAPEVAQVRGVGEGVRGPAALQRARAAAAHGLPPAAAPCMKARLACACLQPCPPLTPPPFAPARWWSWSSG